MNLFAIGIEGLESPMELLQEFLDIHPVKGKILLTRDGLLQLILNIRDKRRNILVNIYRQTLQEDPYIIIRSDKKSFYKNKKFIELILSSVVITDAETNSQVISEIIDQIFNPKIADSRRIEMVGYEEKALEDALLAANTES